MKSKAGNKMMADWRDLSTEDFAKKYHMTITQVKEVKAEGLNSKELQKRLTKIGPSGIFGGSRGPFF